MLNKKEKTNIINKSITIQSDEKLELISHVNNLLCGTAEEKLVLIDYILNLSNTDENPLMDWVYSIEIQLDSFFASSRIGVELNQFELNDNVAIFGFKCENNWLGDYRLFDVQSAIEGMLMIEFSNLRISGKYMFVGIPIPNCFQKFIK